MRKALAVVALALMCAGTCRAYTPGDPEFRAIYVDAWHAGCMSAWEIDTLITNAHSCNANTIVAQVRRRGDTAYPSREPMASGFSSGFDSLAYLVQKCHTTSPRLDVQAWFVVWPVASDNNTPSDPNHPYKKYPQYLTKDESGNTLCSGDYWFDPGNPNAEQYTHDIILDVVNRYAVDAINLDYIRFGGYHFGYNDVSVARFNAAHGRSGLPVYTDTEWCNWRREQVTNFVRKVYANTLAAKPSMKITADCIGGDPAPTGIDDWPTTQAYYSDFQDWRAWMEEGILDMDITMAYFDCAGRYAGDFEPWVCFTRNYAYNRQCAVAPGLYGASCLAEQLGHSRDLPCGPTNGAAIYSYNGLGPAEYDAIRSVWTTPAPIPTMPWKTSPTKGHLRGNVTFAGSAWVDRASITITGPSSRSMTADGTGFYAFIDLPPGGYTVTCTAPDYGTLTKTCTVYAGQVASADFDYPISTLSIANVQSGSETPSGATITWDTNAGSSSKILYGPDRNCALSTTENNTQVINHSVALAGLSPLTTYYYRVYSRNPGAPSTTSGVYAFVTAPSRPEIIVDNPAATYTSGWISASSSVDKYGADYMYASVNATVKVATFTPNIPTAGNYAVYEWHTAGATNRCTAVPHTVNYSGGSQTFNVNQKVAGGVWNSVGTKPFVAGTAGSIQISNQASPDGTIVVADAVRFLMDLETTAPSTPVGLHTTSIQDDYINLAWVASTDNVGVAGYRLYRSGSVVDVSGTTSASDVSVASNTRYTYTVAAFDAAGNRSGTSVALTVCSLVARPTLQTVACDKAAGIWLSAGPFTFTAVNGFGAGKANYYRYAWDTSATHTWTGGETPWSSGTIACAATSSADGYYLHIKGYNQDGRAGDPADLGPFYVDATVPDAPSVTDDGGYTTARTSVHASWTAADPESGIIGYQYAVGTTSGGTQLVGWTPTTATSATIPIAIQDLGTSLYVSVKAQNAALAWGAVGTSDGITVARSVATTSEAKSMADGTVLLLTGKTVSAIYSGFFYVQDDDRSSGIRVEGACAFAVGTKVDVGGLPSTTEAKERSLANAYVSCEP